MLNSSFLRLAEFNGDYWVDFILVYIKISGGYLHKIVITRKLKIIFMIIEDL